MFFHVELSRLPCTQSNFAHSTISKVVELRKCIFSRAGVKKWKTL